jgi:hypothetical protein
MEVPVKQKLPLKKSKIGFPNLKNMKQHPLFTTYNRQLTTNAVKQSLAMDDCAAGQQPLHCAY